MKNYSPVETMVAETDDKVVSLWIHRDHDYSWLEYRRELPFPRTHMIALESRALGRLLRELLDSCPLSLDIQPIEFERDDSKLDTLITVRNGQIPLIAHLPKLRTKKEARIVLDLLPWLPAFALGDWIVRRSTKEHRALRIPASVYG